MHQLTNQEAFDAVLVHIRAQEYKPARGPYATCCYRAPDGKKCAVGCLIPDELYTPDFENVPAAEVHEELRKDDTQQR